MIRFYQNLAHTFREQFDTLPKKKNWTITKNLISTSGFMAVVSKMLYFAV